MSIEDTTIEEYVQIDKRIDAAEEQGFRETTRERWEFGRRMLAEREGKADLPNGRLNELCAATGKGRWELGKRMKFAEVYSTENALCDASQSFTSWRQITQSLVAQGKPNDVPIPTTPKQHDRRDEVIELHRQGNLSMMDIAEQTGLTYRTVRRIVERDNVEQIAKAEEEAAAIAIDWESLPTKVREREAVMRRVIRKEIEREIEPRVQEAVSRRLEAAASNIRTMRDQSLQVLNGRKGILTKAGYDLIRSCLHPDSRLSASDEKLATAFRVFNEAEILLLNEADSPTLASTLPSYEELLKRRR